MNGNQLITKHSANFDTVEKSNRPGVLVTLRGPVTGWKQNRNGRTYSRDLWVKALDSDYVKEQVALNHFVGEADHPEERLEPIIQNMSHAMRDFEFDDENEEVIATIDILDTPCGNMLKTLYDYSGALSFSTRGSGDVLDSGEVDPDTYQLFAIDAVLRPSYATATVRDLLTESESLNKDKDVKSVLESYSGNTLKDDSDEKIFVKTAKDSNGTFFNIFKTSDGKFVDANGVELTDDEIKRFGLSSSLSLTEDLSDEEIQRASEVWKRLESEVGVKEEGWSGRLSSMMGGFDKCTLNITIADDDFTPLNDFGSPNYPDYFYSEIVKDLAHISDEELTNIVEKINRRIKKMINKAKSERSKKESALTEEVNERLKSLLLKKEEYANDTSISDELYYSLIERLDNIIVNEFTQEEIDAAMKELGLEEGCHRDSNKKEDLVEGVSWDYYDNQRFHDINAKYLPNSGEGDTLATQAVTAVNKLVYKWYNDGDVYDNSNPVGMTGWANDLSDYANWLAQNIDGAKDILDGIFNLSYGDESKYEDLLRDLSDLIMDEEYLDQLNSQPKDGSVYNCSGDYSWDENRNYDDEDDYYESDGSLTEDPKSEKEYYILKYHRGDYRLVKGTIERLTNYFSYTLLNGHSWNSKINQHPTTLKGLVNALNASYKETQGSSYDPDFVSIPTPEEIEKYKDTIRESQELSEELDKSYADLVWDKYITGKFADQWKGIEEICNKLGMNYETEFGEIDRLRKWIYSMDDSELRSYFPYLDEAEKLNEYGDTKDYSEEIQKLFKQWFKDNASLGIRAFQSLTDSYYLDIEVRDKGEGPDRKKLYKAINNSPFVEVEDYADEIGNYIADHIPALKYVKFTFNDKSFFSDDETAGDITFYFVQQIGMPDFGEHIFDSEEPIKESDFEDFCDDNHDIITDVYNQVQADSLGISVDEFIARDDAVDSSVWESVAKDLYDDNKYIESCNLLSDYFDFHKGNF